MNKKRVTAEEIADRILREPEVVRRTGASRASLWRWERAGLFPKRVRIGPNAVGWVESEVSQWMKGLPRGVA